MQLWKSYDSFRQQSAFSTWMYRVALNTALMHTRKRARRPEMVDIYEQKIPHLDEHVEYDADDVTMLYQCIHELPRLDRAIILLWLEQHSYSDIAEITGLSRTHVSVRIVRIKKVLHRCLLAKGYLEGKSK